MPKKFLKRFAPNPADLQNHKHLKGLGKLLHDPNLWHFNRRSISGATALGLFCAFIPVPFQMLLAAFGAILLRVNMPVSVLMVWVSNPITMPPLFYGAYVLGAWVLNTPPSEFVFELSWDWLANQLGAIWAPFLLGCLLCGIVCAGLGYLTMRVLWRIAAIRRWQSRNRL